MTTGNCDGNGLDKYLYPRPDSDSPARLIRYAIGDYAWPATPKLLPGKPRDAPPAAGPYPGRDGSRASTYAPRHRRGTAGRGRALSGGAGWGRARADGGGRSRSGHADASVARGVGWLVSAAGLGWPQTASRRLSSRGDSAA
jgi:hypothetical protein